MTAWIAGGALPFLFSTLPANALLLTALALIATALLMLIPNTLLRKAAILLMCAFAGLAWSLYFAQQRLQYEFPADLEGVDLQIEGRVDGLPRGDHQGATFAFVITNYTRLPRGADIDVDIPDLVICLARVRKDTDNSAGSAMAVARQVQTTPWCD
jgi:predicted membrane metal-binding protein